MLLSPFSCNLAITTCDFTSKILQYLWPDFNRLVFKTAWHPSTRLENVFTAAWLIRDY